MKIGTDGVLLGAWTNAFACRTGRENPKKILDIGTGTGLIALMLAQRFPKAELTGIEIDKSSFDEAVFNTSESPFNNRISIVHSSLQDFNPIDKFDLIVSNPPFFELTHMAFSSRNTARQQSELTFEELVFHSERLLAPKGKLSVIIPYEPERRFIELASKYHLFPEKITRIKGNEKAPFKRSLLLFSRNKSALQTDELTIEIARNIYTEEYICLTKDFYLKM